VSPVEQPYKLTIALVLLAVPMVAYAADALTTAQATTAFAAWFGAFSGNVVSRWGLLRKHEKTCAGWHPGDGK
jgi:hypothetical protein